MFRIPGSTELRRNTVVEALVERGLPAFAAFRAVYRTAAFWEVAAPDETPEAIARRCPVSEALTSDGVRLHHRVLLGTEEQMETIAEIVTKTVADLQTRP